MDSEKGTAQEIAEGAKDESDAIEIEGIYASLNLRQQRWVDAYLGEANGNGTTAAELAGYEGGRASLSVRGSRLKANKKIKALIDICRENDPLVMGRIERQRFLSSVGRGEVKEQVLARGAFQEGDRIVDIEVAAKDRLKAVDMMKKTDGEYVERREVSGPGGGPIQGAQSIVIGGKEIVF